MQTKRIGGVFLSEENYWELESFLENQTTEEERKAKREAYQEAKRNKKKRVQGEIPHYVKGRKEGMLREKQITDQWNDAFSTKKQTRKKLHVKQRLSLDLEDEMPHEEEIRGIELNKSFSTKTPTTFIPQKKEEPEAKRQPNSGAMWYAKGDISFEHALMEVKERGTKNGRGEKTISIPKEWLDKQAEEAFLESKEFWYLAFAYKGDSDVYLIKPYDQEIELISELRKLQKENKKLKEGLSNENL